MPCPKCGSLFRNINEEGSYCVRCGFVYYGELEGQNAIEVERLRINRLEMFLEFNQDIFFTIEEISEDLRIPASIIKELLCQLIKEDIIFLNIEYPC